MQFSFSFFSSLFQQKLIPTFCNHKNCPRSASNRHILSLHRFLCSIPYCRSLERCQNPAPILLPEDITVISVNRNINFPLYCSVRCQMPYYNTYHSANYGALNISMKPYCFLLHTSYNQVPGLPSQ